MIVVILNACDKPPQERDTHPGLNLAADLGEDRCAAPKPPEADGIGCGPTPRRRDGDESNVELVTAALETNDPDVLLLGVGDAPRARRMTQIAKDTCLGWQSRLEGPTPRGKPRFETVMKARRGVCAEFTGQAAAPPA